MIDDSDSNPVKKQSAASPHHANGVLPKIRLASTDDGPSVVELVRQVLAEYGETICLADGGAEADLQTIDASYFGVTRFGRSGAFWVLATGRRVIGTHAALPCSADPDVCVFKRLYLDSAYRGTESGQQLMQVTIDWAIEQRFKRIEFWSDVRFSRAHRFFTKFGFERTGKTRTMSDSFIPYQELQFRKIIGT